MTSNRTREVHGALKRRGLYHRVDYRDFDGEAAILRSRAIKPGVAETIDGARCLPALDTIALSPGVICDTLGALLKDQDNIQLIQGSAARKLLDDVRV